MMYSTKAGLLASFVASFIGTSLAAPKGLSQRSASLTDCLGESNVPIVLASDSDWSQYEATYNVRLQPSPVVIAVPSTQADVSNAVKCAVQYQAAVQAKGGGHSYASFSTPDGGLMIDMQNFQQVSVDAGTGIATVGAGLRLGNLATAIYDQSSRALPHGTCAGVGIGGHATHGGYGYSSRAWGLTLDTIVGLDVVLADGSIMHASSTENADLYWALRGAGDAFGIVTTFYLQTVPAPASVINWSYSFSGLFNDASLFAATFGHIQDFALNSSVVDSKLGLGMYMDGTGFSISGTYFGDQNTFTSSIAPELLRTLPAPSSSNVQSLDWLASLQALNGNAPLNEPVSGYNAHDNFFASSVTTPQSDPLTPDALVSYANYIKTQAPTPWYSIINLYGGPGSAINSKDTQFASYAERSNLWVAQHYASSGSNAFPADGITWIQGLNNALKSAMPNVAFGAYLNYVDSTLSAEDAHQIYYGDLYPRLSSIKGQVDSQNVFRNPQSIIASG